MGFEIICNSIPPLPRHTPHPYRRKDEDEHECAANEHGAEVKDEVVVGHSSEQDIEWNIRPVCL